MTDKTEPGMFVTEKSMEILVAKFIPTSQYFERSFSMLQTQIVDLKDAQKELKQDMDRRFEQVDKRFEQVDKRFDSIESKLDTLIDKVDIKIDAGLRENRAISIKLFTFAMIFSAVSMVGVLGKVAGIFN